MIHPGVRRPGSQQDQIKVRLGGQGFTAGKPLVVHEIGDDRELFMFSRGEKLNFAGKFLLSHLNKLSIESLDVRRCQRVELAKAVALPQLKEIVIRPGQFTEEQLRRQIQSNEPFEIRVSEKN